MSKKRQDHYQTRNRAKVPAAPPPQSVVDEVAVDEAAVAALPPEVAASVPAAMAPSAKAKKPAVVHELPVAESTTVSSSPVHSVQADIRGVLIQLAGARLLLPNATIAEVLSYAPPEPVVDAPSWLLGRMRWRGWQLPLIAFAELAGFGKDVAGLGSKVVVLKALGGDAKSPYIAIVTQGFPRLVTVSQDTLVVDGDSGELPLGLQARVLLNDDAAFVPDLEAVESLIAQALAQAA